MIQFKGILNFNYSLNKHYYSFLSILFIFFISCNKTKEKEFSKKLNFNEEEYSKVLKNRFDATNDTFNLCYTNFIFFDTLSYYYKKNNYKAIFTSSISQLQTSEEIVAEIAKSWENGLNSNHYLIAFLKENLSQINKNNSQNIINYSLNATTEVLLANACLSYNKDLALGRINPKKIFDETYFLPLKNDSLFNLFEPIKNDNIISVFNKNTIKSKEYIEMKNQLLFYDSLAINTNFEIIPDTILKIYQNDTILFIDKIAKRLLLTKDLSKQEFTLCSKVFYDSILFKSISQFQENNGLLNDGVIGKNTIDALNQSFESICKKIAINMDRLRWIKEDENEKKITINIADFTLTAKDSGRTFLKMKVCVGEKKDKNYDAKMKQYLKTKKALDRPLIHETPNLYGSIGYMILNPTWSVPKNIAEREIYFSVLKDSTYLQSKNFLVYKGDSLVNPAKINWRSYKPDKLPFRFVQDAGHDNALGKMKFIFSNRFNIYLHDTPSQLSFNRANRAVSHGCVRVAEPINLAFFLLKDNKKFGADEFRMQLEIPPINEKKLKDYEKKIKLEKELFKIDESLKTKKEEDLKKTKTINFERKTLLYIDYRTAWVNEANHLQLRPDIYNRDKEIQKAFFLN